MGTNNRRCRIGDTYFETFGEAEEWVAAGNIGGTYSIVEQVSCQPCVAQDTWYNQRTQEYVCHICAEPLRAVQAKLKAWNNGAKITAQETHE